MHQIKEVIRQGVEVPEGQNDLRRMQLRELALLNGTLRETDGPRCTNCGHNTHESWQCPEKPNLTASVICSSCGSAGHIAKVGSSSNSYNNHDCLLYKILQQSFNRMFFYLILTFITHFCIFFHNCNYYKIDCSSWGNDLNKNNPLCRIVAPRASQAVGTTFPKATPWRGRGEGDPLSTAIRWTTSTWVLWPSWEKVGAVYYLTDNIFNNDRIQRSIFYQSRFYYELQKVDKG